MIIATNLLGSVVVLRDDNLKATPDHWQVRGAWVSEAPGETLWLAIASEVDGEIRVVDVTRVRVWRPGRC